MLYLILFYCCAVPNISTGQINYNWNSSNGTYQTAANWSPFVGAPPDSAFESAIFDLPGDYTVSLTSSVSTGSATFAQGNATLNITGSYSVSALTLAPVGGNTNSLSVTGSIDSSIAIVGANGGTDSTLTLTPGGIWTNSGEVTIGDAGTGDLVMDSIAFLSTCGFLNLPCTKIRRSDAVFGNTILGAAASGSGNANINGTWDSGNLVIGDFGTGTLKTSSDVFVVLGQPLTLRGTITSNNVDIAARPGSQGSVSIPEEFWGIAGDMHVGGTASGAGGMANVTIGGEVTSAGDVVIWPSGSVVVDGLPGATRDLEIAGQLVLNGGRLNVSGGSFQANTIQAEGTVSIPGGFHVTGTDGDLTTVGQSRMGISGHATIDLTGGTWTSDAVTMAENAGSSAVATVSGSGIWTAGRSVYVGGTSSAAGGSGSLIVNGGSMTVADTLKIWDSSTLTVTGGSVVPQLLDIAGTVSVTNGGVDLTANTAIVRAGGLLQGQLGTDLQTTVRVEGPSGVWQVSGELAVGGVALGTQRIGTLDLAGGTVMASQVDFGVSPFVGFGNINASVRSAGSMTATGNLTLGNASDFDGVNLGGILNVGPHTVEIRKLGTFILGNNTQIAGGTLIASAGVALPVGGNFAGRGEISGRFSQQAGSTLQATDTLRLGDATVVNGFYSNGTLDVGQAKVTLLDSNDAVFDSGALVTLGIQVSTFDFVPGTLQAENGLTLDFGGNVAGAGTVDSMNDPSTPLTNNGHIRGFSLTDPITLTGYVRGVGTCDNCNILGTDSPGFSPATVTRGSVRYNGALEIEIGGLSPGSQHDQLNHVLGAGIADLGGTLDVLLIDGFTPSQGDTFRLINATVVQDVFDVHRLPDLGGGFQFDVIYSVDAVTLAVIGVAGDYNLDGTVDAADFSVWRDTFGELGSGLAADGDQSGAVDAADYGVWATNFGLNASALSSQVPEPTAFSLMCAAAFILGVCRRSRRAPILAVCSP